MLAIIRRSNADPQVDMKFSLKFGCPPQPRSTKFHHLMVRCARVPATPCARAPGRNPTNGWSAAPECQRRNATKCGPQRPPGLRCLGPYAKMPQRPPGLRCPDFRKFIHINLFHAFVKKLIILCRTCGMFLPFTIPTKLMYILSCGNDSLESKQGQPGMR